MMSRIPPASPASIMLLVRSSKTFGYCFMALARVAPPSTVVRTPVRVFWKAGFSWFAARISRHCTRGRPASIMTENWRKKMAMSLVLILPLPKVGIANSLPFSRMAPGVMRSRRNWVVSTCLLAAVRSPLIFSPDAFLPENVKTGIVNFSSLHFVLPGPNSPELPLVYVRPYSHSWLRRQSRGAGLALAGRGTFRHGSGLITIQAGSTADHFLQFVLVAGARHRHFNGDLFLEIRCRQRLIKRLHSELVLAGLHGRVNLVDLVFADQVADGRVGNHDLHAHGTALVVDPGQQALAHDAFQNQR